VRLSGSTTEPRGAESTGIWLTSSPAARSTTETLESHQFETSATDPSGEREMNFGTRPTSMTWSHSWVSRSSLYTAEFPIASPAAQSSVAVSPAPGPLSEYWET
jgi:hypothetical protein